MHFVETSSVKKKSIFVFLKCDLQDSFDFQWPSDFCFNNSNEII